MLVYLATFVSVFTLGLQSLNVNQGHYLAAAVTSFFIGSGHIFLYRYMPAAGCTSSSPTTSAASPASPSRSGSTSARRPGSRSSARAGRRAGRLTAAADEHCDVANCGDRRVP
jgi:hypothetical protein